MTWSTPSTVSPFLFKSKWNNLDLKLGYKEESSVVHSAQPNTSQSHKDKPIINGFIPNLEFLKCYGTTCQCTPTKEPFRSRLKHIWVWYCIRMNTQVVHMLTQSLEQHMSLLHQKIIQRTSSIVFFISYYCYYVFPKDVFLWQQTKNSTVPIL